MLNYHRSFKDALLSVLLKIPAEGKSAVSYPIVLHEGRKAGGQQILVELPKLPNLASSKRISVWLEHTDALYKTPDGLAGGPPGSLPPFDPPGEDQPPYNPPKSPPKDPPKKPDTEPPKGKPGDDKEPGNPGEDNCDVLS